jgi:hypothetical protein
MRSSLLSRRLCIMTILAASLLFLPLTTTTTNNITLAQSNDGKGGLTTTQNSSGSFKTNDNTTTALAAGNLTAYQNDVDGFRIGIHDGWVIQDVDNTTPESRDRESKLGFAPIAGICPQEGASLTANGTYECPPNSSPDLTILRFSKLSTRQEFQPAIQRNGTITMNDFLGFVTQFLQGLTGLKNFQLADSVEQPVNVIDPQTNQTLSQVPSRIILYTYSVPNPFSGPNPLSGKGLELRDIDLVAFHAAVLSNYTDTGYIFYVNLTPASVMGNLSHEHMGEQMGMMMDSFELLATTKDGGVATK